jgi:hypothetical protein
MGTSTPHVDFGHFLWKQALHHLISFIASVNIVRFSRLGGIRNQLSALKVVVGKFTALHNF